MTNKHKHKSDDTLPSQHEKLEEGDIIDHLTFLYGQESAAKIWPRLRSRLEVFCRRILDENTSASLQEATDPAERLTERDVILITYGDQVRSGEYTKSCISDCPRPLQILAEVLETYVSGSEQSEGIINGLHILPFFPYSSDDGFSVIDYTAVNPDFGTWEDIQRLRKNFRLMFDLVINHISAHSDWFKAFLEDDPEFVNAFIVVEPGTDLSQVVRPRALPLLTPVQTASGEKLVWTTFSQDQIDLNFADPDMLLRMIDVLLFYIEQGAEIIRLDAIAYLWKKIGTSCIHLEETHRVVKLFRSILDAVAPSVLLITETNVPHEENISYFGDGTDEAQMVYQFPLPPLVLHTLATGDATYLTKWATELCPPSAQTTFYNFLASHDGIGVRPVEGILNPDEVQALVDRTLAHGGYVSYKTNADGSKSVYELNISYFDALSAPNGDEPLELQVRRFMASQAIMLALQGVPAVYVHSLFGSRNFYAGVEQTGRYRSINREKFRRPELEEALNNPKSLRAQVFTAYRDLLQTRVAHSAFHPNALQQVLALHPALFAVLRVAPNMREQVLCLHNVTNTSLNLVIDILDHNLPQAVAWHNLLSEPHPSSGDMSAGSTSGGNAAASIWPVTKGALEFNLAPYQVLWLTAEM